MEQNVLKLLVELKSRNLVMQLKIYEILRNMQVSGMIKNEREIFYMSVNTFRNQASVRRLIKRTASELQVSRLDLGIRNTLKGVFVGRLAFVKNKKTFPMESADGNPQLIPDMSDIDDVLCDQKTTVVMEKDTMLSSVVFVMKEETAACNVLLVCGKGYPCRNTMMLLKMLEGKSRVFGLFDFDPFGLHIYIVYKYGSIASPELKVESMHRIRMNDVFGQGVSENDLVPLNRHDCKMIQRLMGYSELVEDLQLLKSSMMKLELEAFFSR